MSDDQLPFGAPEGAGRAGGRVGACAPVGFAAAGIAAGIKDGGRKDLAVIVSDRPAVGAGVFTTNVAKAAPVLVSRHHLADSPVVRAVVMSSGNANAATGVQGRAVCEAMCDAVAHHLGVNRDEILIAQTGLIGFHLDAEVCRRGTTAAVSLASPDGGADAADAILTTDTVAKTATATIEVGQTTVTFGAMAKGAAMLAPSMATMLALVTTDAAASAEVVQTALRDAMPNSFHSMVVDANRSTNDTVFLVANGASGAETIETTAHPAYPAFAAAVAEVCRSLAEQMARDAEGATKFLTMTVRGAASVTDARVASRAVASSILSKCSLAGEDPYWGRILADIGASGAIFDPEAVTISYGGVVVARHGIGCEHDTAAVAAHMRGRDIDIVADLGAGAGEAFCYGCDLTHAYVDENVGTS